MNKINNFNYIYNNKLLQNILNSKEIIFFCQSVIIDTITYNETKRSLSNYNLEITRYNISEILKKKNLEKNKLFKTLFQLLLLNNFVTLNVAQKCLLTGLTTFKIKNLNAIRIYSIFYNNKIYNLINLLNYIIFKKNKIIKINFNLFFKYKIS